MLAFMDCVVWYSCSILFYATYWSRNTLWPDWERMSCWNEDLWKIGCDMDHFKLVTGHKPSVLLINSQRLDNVPVQCTLTMSTDQYDRWKQHTQRCDMLHINGGTQQVQCQSSHCNRQGDVDGQTTHTNGLVWTCKVSIHENKKMSC